MSRKGVKQVGTLGALAVGLYLLAGPVQGAATPALTGFDRLLGGESVAAAGVTPADLRG